MIAMTNLGSFGRLGNQLFQYAFMRTQSDRLGCSFYVPKWIGDDIFSLNDIDIRCKDIPQGLNFYKQKFEDCGFDPVMLEPNTNVCGHFQSEKCFDRDLIRSVYQFKEKIVMLSSEVIQGFDRELDACLHIRLKDFKSLPEYYIPTFKFYNQALKMLNPRRIYLFSDDLNSAKVMLKKLDFASKIILVSTQPEVDLAAMSNFKKIIIGPSTFAWWGAWLAKKDKVVIVPSEGALRPGSPVRASDYWPSEFIKIRSLNLLGSYHIHSWLNLLGLIDNR